MLMASFQDSATDLLMLVKKRLLNTGYSQHRQLQVSIDHGSVVVAGHVPSFYLRQVAIECVRRVPGVMRVIDQIAVRDCGDEFEMPGTET